MRSARARTGYLTQIPQYRSGNSERADQSSIVRFRVRSTGSGAALIRSTVCSRLASTERRNTTGKARQYVSVPVRINDTITLPFVLDTGATDLVIPADVALTLIRAGALTSGDFLGKSRYSMANGSEQVSDRVMIRAVQVGDHIIRNVTAMVSPPAGDPLLGQSSVEIWCGDPRLQTACSRFITLRK